MFGVCECSYYIKTPQNSLVVGLLPSLWHQVVIFILKFSVMVVVVDSAHVLH